MASPVAGWMRGLRSKLRGGAAGLSPGGRRFESDGRYLTHARVAKWQTRLIQDQVSQKEVWVQVPPRARAQARSNSTTGPATARESGCGAAW